MSEKSTDSVQESLEFLDAMSDVEPIQHDKVIHDTPKPTVIPLKSNDNEQQALKEMLSNKDKPLKIQHQDILNKCRLGIQNGVFLDAMSDVNPFYHDKVLHNTIKPSTTSLKNTHANLDGEQQVFKDMLSDEYEPLDVQPSDILSFCSPGIQNRVFRKLRSGQYQISDELDLHGMNVKQAKERLLYYLHYVKQYERSCIRIIHGKGHRSNNKGPVLKRKVDHWLQCHGRVLAYHSALSCDGGTGAIYLLLKRQY